MSQDSRVFFRIFFGIGLVLILISVVIFYNQFTYSKDAIHTEGVIVDTVWHSSHSHRTGKNGSWYPVVAFRPTPDYTLIFNSSIGSDFYEGSEGDKVNVYYSPGHPEKAEINNPWVNFFKWGFIGIMGVIFISVGLLISMPSSKRHAGNGSPAHEKIIILLSLLILLPLTATSKPLIPIMKTLLRMLPVLYQMLKRSRIKPSFFANKPELHRLLWFYPTLIMKPVSGKMAKRCWRMRHLQ